MRLVLAICATLASSTSALQLSRRWFCAAGFCAAASVPAPSVAGQNDYNTELFYQGGCGRRGPLGACLGGAELPADTTKADEKAAAQAGAENAARAKEGMIDEASPLVAKLRKQTEENSAKNKRQVELEMFANSQSGEFGPFSRYVPVERSDGEFVLVRVKDYERLRKQKKISKNQKFLDDADAREFGIVPKVPGDESSDFPDLPE